MREHLARRRGVSRRPLRGSDRDLACCGAVRASRTRAAIRRCSSSRPFLTFIYLLVYAFAVLFIGICLYNLCQTLRARGCRPASPVSCRWRRCFRGAAHWLQPRVDEYLSYWYVAGDRRAARRGASSGRCGSWGSGRRWSMMDRFSGRGALMHRRLNSRAKNALRQATSPLEPLDHDPSRPPRDPGRPSRRDRLHRFRACTSC